jgi:hypothetical protein
MIPVTSLKDGLNIYFFNFSETMASSLPMKTTKKPEAQPKSRHCAFCLNESPDTKTCSGCNKRAYCSVACQEKDWSPSGQGQGHKNWCKVACCEEDVDWKVQEVPGKGLGLVALKDIPAMARVLVDRFRTWEEAKDDPRLAGIKIHNSFLC